MAVILLDAFGVSMLVALLTDSMSDGSSHKLALLIGILFFIVWIVALTRMALVGIYVGKSGLRYRGRLHPYDGRDLVYELDVEGDPMEPSAVYDLKTGSATLRPARIAQIQANLPQGYQDIPVIEIRP